MDDSFPPKFLNVAVNRYADEKIKESKNQRKIKHIIQRQADTECVQNMLKASTQYALKFANMATQIQRIKTKGKVIQAKKKKLSSSMMSLAIQSKQYVVQKEVHLN